jgi:hypothetical protein
MRSFRPRLLRGQLFGAIGILEELPCFGDLQQGQSAEEASSDNPVVRVVGLEEERPAGRENSELAAAARLPEIDLCKPRAACEKSVPPPSVSLI